MALPLPLLQPQREEATLGHRPHKSPGAVPTAASENGTDSHLTRAPQNRLPLEGSLSLQDVLWATTSLFERRHLNSNAVHKLPSDTVTSSLCPREV